MSTLKQEILKEVLKGENVLQSYDSTASSNHGNEGNVYECRFDAPVYDTETGAGITALENDLRKYSRLDSNGDSVTYVVKKANGVGQELVYNADSSGKIGKIGDALHIETFFNTTVALLDDEDLLKNNNKYFIRAHAALEGAGQNDRAAKLVGTDSTQKVFLVTNEILKESWEFISGKVFDQPSGTTGSAAASQLIFPVLNPTTSVEEARTFEKNFIGKIDANTTTIAKDTIFYYDGSEAIFDDGQGGPKTAKGSAKGWYMVLGADIDISDQANANKEEGIFYSASNLAGKTIPQGQPYVLALAGDGSPFAEAAGHTTLESAEIVSPDKVWTSTINEAGQRTLIMDPAATNDYWALDAAATEPVDAAGAATGAGWVLTTADGLDDSEYWNKISEGFIEDYDVPVGFLGLEGADNGGVYSPLDAAGAAKSGYTGYSSSSTPALVAGSNTYRKNRIVSTTAAGTNTPVRVTTEFRHGLEPGDTVTIDDVEDGAGNAIPEVNNASTVGKIGGVSGTDPFTFELEGTDLTTLGVASVASSSGKGMVNVVGIPHLVWGSHNPPTTDQALVYRH